MRKCKGLLVVVVLAIITVLTACGIGNGGNEQGGTQNEQQGDTGNGTLSQGYTIYDINLDLMIYVGQDDTIAYVETWSEEKMNLGIQNVMGQNLEEGLAQLYQDYLYQGGYVDGSSYFYWEVVTMEEGGSAVLKEKMDKVLADVIAGGDFATATGEVNIVEFTASTAPEDYARYEELKVTSYEEVAAIMDKYHQMAVKYVLNPSEDLMAEVGVCEVEINGESDCPIYMIYEKQPVPKRLSVSSPAVSLQVEKLGGIDAYRVLFRVNNSYASAIYYKDGTKVEEWGYALFYKDLDGEAEYGYVYLEDATLDSYDEVHRIFTQYEDMVEKVDDWWENLYVRTAKDESILIMKFLEDGTYSVCWPNREDGDIIYDETYLYGPNNYLGYEKIAYDKDGQCLSQYYETPEKTQEITWTYGAITYCKTVTTIKETGKVMWEETKTLSDGTSYPLRKENENLIREYTYTSEDSGILQTYYAYSSYYEEEVLWTFDGTGPYGEDYTSHVVSLKRTYEGVTTTYTRDQIPWGSGILYPPHSDVELNQ